ncbi:MAG TPA: hypothetical protein VER17_11150 [Tepidisphaeraceae bacterium]|nr:hypothetical protein [Tepidisphaeraceae bacterium]
MRKPPTTAAAAEAAARAPFETADKRDADAAPRPFTVDVKLALPPRGATRIARLRGSFQVLGGGEEKVIAIDKLKSRAGRPVDDPVLSAAGLKLEITQPDPGRPAEVGLHFSGHLDALGEDVQFADAQGKDVKTRHVGVTGAEGRTATYNLGRELDDPVVVRVPVLVGQRVETVPFDVKDVQLP